MSFRSPVVVNHPKIDVQLQRFPSSRYMGSKHAILPFLYATLKGRKFETVLDAFSGSAAVSYLFKAMGKSVTSNDFLRFSFHTAQACIANSSILVSDSEIEKLLAVHDAPEDFILRTFAGLYFSDEENEFLESVSAHIREMTCPSKQSIAYAAIVRACLRRRPRGIFTYTGVRYEDGRRDLQMSMEQQFRGAITLFNQAIFDNGRRHYALNQNIFEIPKDAQFDLVYLDPPYVSPLSDNDYTRRYHFVEGLTRYWEGLEIVEATTTKKFRRFPSLFDSKTTVHHAFSSLFERFQDSIIAVSYSSNGIPSKEELTALLRQYKRTVKVYEFDHRYSFGTHSHKIGDNQNEVKEFLFVGS